MPLSVPLVRVLRFMVATIALLIAPVLLTADEPVEPPTFHHRVLWMKNPQHEAVLSWTTREAGERHVVHYDTVARGGDAAAYAMTATSFKDGMYTMKDADAAWVQPAFFHHVHLAGLAPDTIYYVAFSSDGAVSREFHFRTAPAEDIEFAMLFGGDSRIGTSDPYKHTDRQNMNLRMRALFEEFPNIYGLIHGGDYCMLAEWRYLQAWLSDHELTTTEAGRLLPIIPARGNHDRGIGFEEMFSWPNFDRNYYYKTSLSPAVTLVTLNTETSLGGDQRDWLEATLQATRPDSRWLLVSYHRPAFSSVRPLQDGASRRDNWVPLFEKFNVDLVLESHDHALKRTLPIRSAAHDPKNGIVYIGDGGLGVPQRTPDPTRWWLQEPGFTKSVHHVHVLEFGAEGMRVRAFGMDAEIHDDFTLTPRNAPTGVAATQ